MAEVCPALMVGLILHALYQARSMAAPSPSPSPSLSDIDSMLSDPDRDISELWMEMFTAKRFWRNFQAK